MAGPTLFVVLLLRALTLGLYIYNFDFKILSFIIVVIVGTYVLYLWWWLTAALTFCFKFSLYDEVFTVDSVVVVEGNLLAFLILIGFWLLAFGLLL